MEDIENRLASIVKEVQSNLENIVSEEDAKIQIINRLLTEILGWSFSSLSAENHHENGFSDYIIKKNDDPCFLIEAKRIGKLDIKTTETDKVRYLKLSGSALQNCIEGIEQAASYSIPNGIVLSVLTDGISWIVFKGFVQGSNFKEKEAIVFPSLESIQNDFSTFYELLSSEDIGRRTYNQVFDLVHNKRINLSREFYAPVNQSEIKIAKKSELAFDLDRVFERYLSAMAGSDDEELIVECFVETRESRFADFSLEKMTAKVLGNITTATDVQSQLSSLIATSVDAGDKSGADQSVFIVGPTGAGKTTFLERFFKKTLTRTVREQCVLINVNCLDSTGNEETIIDWLTEQLIFQLEHGLFDDGVATWNQLRSLYHREYLRRAKGVDEKLYQSDKNAFQISFGRYMDELVERDREGYLKRLLLDLVNNRKKLPIFVVDNTDENSIEFKQRIFQFFQSLRREVKHTLLIFPVTDKSAWAFSKTDIFGIYDSRSFYLPTPSPREVFRKRAEYLKGKIQFVKTHSESGRYFAEKGITISIEDLDSFTKILENIFVDHDFTSKTIGELTNFNIRRTLKLSQRVLTSSIIRIEDLVRSYVSGKPIVTKYTKFIDALLRGNYQIYKKGDTPEIISIFDVDHSIIQSPLLSLRILSVLKTTLFNGRDIEEQHMSVSSIVSYFDSIGCSEVAVEKSILQLVEAGLVEPYDASTSKLSPNQKVAITHKGKSHLNLGTKTSVFFYQMALTTQITDENVTTQIRQEMENEKVFAKRVAHIKSLFAEYLLVEDGKYLNQTIQAEQYENQRDLLRDIAKYTSRDKNPSDDLESTLGVQFQVGYKEEEVIAIVEWYDPRKKWGFAKWVDLDEGAFINLDTLVRSGVSYVTEGDQILCDISRNEKGFQIDKIHDIELDEASIERHKCRVLRVFHDRQYGFASIGDNIEPAFFHTYLLEDDRRTTIQEEDEFLAEVVMDELSGSLQIRKIL